jgi:pyruvate/2-oxoglutarate dehydrogenase complex dihydrolipoamide acyltransferase (E2) component
MAIEIVVPRLGWSMEEGVFQEWLFEAGAAVKPGDALFVIESDKAAQEVESFDAGILAIPVNAPAVGDKVIVGQLLGYLLAEGESVPEVEGARVLEKVSPPPAAQPETASGTKCEEAPQTARGRVPVTPRARRKARELGVDLVTVSIPGTGRGGRVRERDILDSARTIHANGSREITFLTARAMATQFDSMVADIVGQMGNDYTRRDLLGRLLKVALSEHRALNIGEAIELGYTFGLTDFTERRIENWVPEIPAEAVAALGIGRAAGEPMEFPLNLSFDSSRIGLDEAASFLDRLCQLIETPVLALVR